MVDPSDGTPLSGNRAAANGFESLETEVLGIGEDFVTADPDDDWQGIKDYDTDGAQIVLLPNSEYLIEQHPVTLDADDLSIIGPPSATVKVADGVVGENGDTGEIEFNGNDGFISGWTFDGNELNQDADDVYGLKFNGTGWTVENQDNVNACGDGYLVRDGMLLDNVDISGFTEDGVDIQCEGDGCDIQNSYIEGPWALSVKTRSDLSENGNVNVTNSTLIGTNDTASVRATISDTDYLIKNLVFKNSTLKSDGRMNDAVRIGGDAAGTFETIRIIDCNLDGRRGVVLKEDSQTNDFIIRGGEINSDDRTIVFRNAVNPVVTRLTINGDGPSVNSSCEDVRLYGDYNWSDVNDSGVRTTLNDVGRNGTSDPRDDGDWNPGFNAYQGVVVTWDDGTDRQAEKYLESGWVNLGTV